MIKKLKVLIMVLPLLFTIFPLRNVEVHAAYNDFGSQVTAEIKLFYNSFAECLSKTSAYSLAVDDVNNWLGLFVSDEKDIAIVKSDYIRNLKYFGEGMGAAAQNNFGWGHGAIIENDTTGGYSNGSFYCGEGGTGPTSAYISSDDNYVTRNFVGFVNNNLNITGNGKNIKSGALDPIELACSIIDTDDAGVFKGTADGTTCKGAYNGSKMQATKSLVNVKNILKYKVFGTDSSAIPGGSFGTYTDIEKYYLYLRAFDKICISDTDPDEGGGLTKTVQNENGEWVTNHYSFTPRGKNETMDSEIYVYSYNDGESWHKASCSKLSQFLTEGNPLAANFNEYRERVDNGDIDTEEDTWQDPDLVTDEAYAECKDQLTLGWLICPLLFGLANGADALDSWVEGLFE